MNFDIQKFIAYNVDPTGRAYKSLETGCIKCAMVESLGHTASDSKYGAISYHHVYKDTPKNFFEREGGVEFKKLMDEAEVHLIKGMPVEQVKKFVIDGMLAQGLIKPESLSKELEHAK